MHVVLHKIKNTTLNTILYYTHILYTTNLQF